MREFAYCPHCSKNFRLSEDIGLSVYIGGQDFLYQFVLIVPESSAVFPLFNWVYHVSFKERMLEAEIQGRQDDAEEEAFFEEVERLRKGE